MHDCDKDHKKDKDFITKILRQISDFVVEKHGIEKGNSEEHLWELVEETNSLLFNIAANVIDLYSNEDEMSFSINAMRFIGDFSLMIGKVQIGKNMKKDCEYDD